MDKVVTVKELKELWNSGNYEIEIDTPDGFVPITKWFDKGVLPMVRVETKSGLVTECAVNHLLQDESSLWVPAGSLEIGMNIISENNISDEIVTVTEIEPAECYDFTVDHLNHRYWGDGFSSHNSGKSFIASGNLVREAQKKGIFVILVDTENALDEAWLHALGVDTAPDKLLKVNAAMIDDVAKLISSFMKEYKATWAGLTDEEKANSKVLFVVDSLGMLMTPTEINQFEAGEMKGDMGRKAKQLKALVTNCVNMFGEYDVGMIATNHSYQSQDQYNPDQIISGGSGFIFASSIVVSMRKLKLKEDDDGNKISEVAGIRSKCKVVKSRYSKPFEEVEIKIPWESGMNPMSGLFELFEADNVLIKEGNRYVYTPLEGLEPIKMWRKDYINNKDGILELIMKEYITIKERRAQTQLKEQEQDEVTIDIDIDEPLE
jgi:recombination protein RecA